MIILSLPRRLLLFVFCDFFFPLVLLSFHRGFCFEWKVCWLACKIFLYNSLPLFLLCTPSMTIMSSGSNFILNFSSGFSQCENRVNLNTTPEQTQGCVFIYSKELPPTPQRSGERSAFLLWTECMHITSNETTSFHEFCLSTDLSV